VDIQLLSVKNRAKRTSKFQDVMPAFDPKQTSTVPFKRPILPDTITHLSVRAAMKRREIIALLGGATWQLAEGMP
jgi:hypothetical protein